MAVQDHVPKALRGPIGFASLAIMLFGIIIGYILFTVGITLYFDMTPIESSAVSTFEALSVTGIGLASVVVGYLGWRGFNYFAY